MSMKYIPTETGFMRLEDSERLVTGHLPKLSLLGAAPSRANSGTDCPGHRRSEQLAMFRITARICRTFTLAEILIIAAMNVEAICMGSEGSVPPKTTATENGQFSTNHFLLVKANFVERRERSRGGLIAQLEDITYSILRKDGVISGRGSRDPVIPLIT
jgi:hypothetical protein